jgi:hypothetical protein
VHRLVLTLPKSTLRSACLPDDAVVIYKCARYKVTDTHTPHSRAEKNFDDEFLGVAT